MKRRAVFLDRDGVLNQAVPRAGKCHPPADAAALEITPGAPEALAALRGAGYALICVTNQPDVARGLRSPANVEAMNRKVMALLPLDDLLVCPHDDADGCDCRKPKPGLLLTAAARWGLELKDSWMVGDRKSDVAAGRAAGCRTVFIDCRYAEGGPEKPADYSCASLPQAAEFILGNAEIPRTGGSHAARRSEG